MCRGGTHSIFVEPQNGVHATSKRLAGPAVTTCKGFPSAHTFHVLQTSSVMPSVRETTVQPSPSTKTVDGEAPGAWVDRSALGSYPKQKQSKLRLRAKAHGSFISHQWFVMENGSPNNGRFLSPAKPESIRSLTLNGPAERRIGAPCSAFVKEISGGCPTRSAPSAFGIETLLGEVLTLY